MSDPLEFALHEELLFYYYKDKFIIAPATEGGGKEKEGGGGGGVGGGGKERIVIDRRSGEVSYEPGNGEALSTPLPPSSPSTKDKVTARASPPSLSSFLHFHLLFASPDDVIAFDECDRLLTFTLERSASVALLRHLTLHSFESVDCPSSRCCISPIFAFYE